MPKGKNSEGLSPGEEKILNRLDEITAALDDLAERINDLKDELREEN